MMVCTHLGETLSDFMTKLRNQLQIRMDQLLQVSFGCKTLKMEVSLAENGLGELDTANLSLPLADRMQGVHISSLIRFQVEKQKDDKEMAQSSNPTSGSLVVHPHSAVTESSIQLLGTGWTRSQTGQLQLLPNPLQAVQIDRALFVMGDLQVVPQIEMSSPVFNEQASAFLNTMTQQGGEVGAMIPFDSNSIDPVQKFLARYEEALVEMWAFSGWLRKVNNPCMSLSPTPRGFVCRFRVSNHPTQFFGMFLDLQKFLHLGNHFFSVQMLWFWQHLDSQFCSRGRSQRTSIQGQ